MTDPNDVRREMERAQDEARKLISESVLRSTVRQIREFGRELAFWIDDHAPVCATPEDRAFLERMRTELLFVAKCCEHYPP